MKEIATWMIQEEQRTIVIGDANVIEVSVHPNI